MINVIKAGVCLPCFTKLSYNLHFYLVIRNILLIESVQSNFKKTSNQSS